MKQIFEQPELLVQRFAVEDQLMISGLTLGENETDILDAISGDAIVSRS